MKRLLSIVLIGLAFIMPLQGFSSELDLAPNEKVTVGDLDHDFSIVISSDIVNDLVINTHTGSLDTIYVLERVAATNSNTNHFGLPSTSIVMDKVFITYPYINEWKTNRRTLNFKLIYTKNESDSSTRIRYLNC